MVEEQNKRKNIFFLGVFFGFCTASFLTFMLFMLAGNINIIFGDNSLVGNNSNDLFLCNPYYFGSNWSYPRYCENSYINSTGNYCNGVLVCENGKSDDEEG